jgi:ribosomal protein S17
MNVIKKTSDYTIYQKRSNRYAVKDANNRWVSGDDKVKILLAEKLVKLPEPKPKEAQEEAAEETTAEE